ncbi:hypothetical protein Mycch_4742 [Mycolicibacterium chubuense NBB4]|uniref:Uncharacterized protein n=1 Tax=Mycolicibacterium chubuense (strain NBB4) TaxID=710421 RepID=I4BQ86_MYCCN|nr:hypothetical protein [Mycolicibacterium chubuense]AFM19443.1 hypothetical protein Mycch_4742 [Mycolicibacterium chubuense NBB4]
MKARPNAFVDGLNSRDPKDVDLLRNISAVPGAEKGKAHIDQNIVAVSSLHET